jgi:ABC-type bacteriocin/lantibiotic exporter with double-glycine peptidase domain
VNESAASETDIRPSISYVGILKCGPNSLFLFLILLGHTEVTLEQLEKLPVSSEGTSLLTLRDAARHYHVDAENRHYSIEDISLLPLPAIVQFKSGADSVTRYHFNVIYKVSLNRVYMIDGTTGEKSRVSKSWLSDHWTGNAMSERRSIHTFIANEWQYLLLTMCFLIVDFIILFKITRLYKGIRVVKETGITA